MTQRDDAPLSRDIAFARLDDLKRFAARNELGNGAFSEFAIQQLIDTFAVSDRAATCSACGHGNRLNGEIVHAGNCPYYGATTPKGTIMNKRTRTALLGSIKKWEDIVALKGGDYGTQNCPLCKEFFIDSNPECDGCPVSEATGKSCCDGSPYERWAHEPGWEMGQLADTPARMRHAKSMVRFLKRLDERGQG